MTPKTPGYRVLIKPDTLETFDPVIAAAKRSGIVLQDADERKEATAIDSGIVLQLGPVAFSDRGGVDAWCKVGDRVSYARHGGKILKSPGNPEEKYLVVNDEDIVMVWETTE
jgi:co-chaperonin GroES (HSP10)